MIADFGKQPITFDDVQVSPDGGRLLLIARENRAIYTVSTDGTELTTVVSWPEQTYEPTQYGASGPLWYERRLFASWSPDGSRIAILDEFPDRQHVLLTAKPDGTDLKVLVTRYEGNLEPGYAAKPYWAR